MAKIPNYKHQITNKSQITNPNDPNCFDFSIIDILSQDP